MQPITLKPSIEDELKREQLKLLYAPLHASLLAASINGLVILFLMWQVISQPVLLSWFAALLATFIYRLVDRYQFNRVAGGAFIPLKWEKRFILGVSLSALVWGSGAILLFASESIALQVFLAFIFAGITAGSISTLSPSFHANLIFLIIALLPLSLRLWFTGTPLSITMGALIFLYTLMLIASSRRFHQNIMENLQLRYEAQWREEKLHESEEKYRLLFERSEDPMWLISGNKFTMANRAAVNLLGYDSVDQLADTHPSELSPPLQSDGLPSLEKADEMMRIAYETGFNRFEWIHKKRSGELFPVDVNLTRIPSEGEDAIFCTWRDISKQKETEQALINAKEAADLANNSKSAFLATMSHEIRTPIHGVLGMTQLLQESPLTLQQQEYLDTIQLSGNSLLNIINEILDLSKIEAGELKLESRSFNLTRVVDEIYRLLAPGAEEKGLSLHIDISDTVPSYLTGDSERLRQILINLIGNAIKFTEQGTVTLKIASQNTQNNRSLLKFEIIDSGIGIPTELQQGLFNPFTQADDSTARKYGGSGLGLAISKCLVDMMGGEMGVQSKPSEGSTFWFKLQLESATADSEEDIQSELSGEHLTLQGSVLLVEDNAVNAMIAHAMIADGGMQIDVAENGEQAIEMYQKQPYDLILMDCQMPVMDGYQATAAIRNLENGERHIPIIAITANASEEDRQLTIDAGMDDFISKPFKREILLKTLSRWLKQ